ncbi:MAG: DUF4870 domain-containing protein [Anaerolineales bacterium]|nr:DUF4870 domain-containing protein [Anaerolineales bacterium]
MNAKPSIEERIWAAIVHLSTLAMGIGLFLPIFGWSESRRKSNYTSFQCLQALGYQTLGYTVWILTMLIVAIVSGVGFLSRVQNMDTLEADLNAWAAGHSILMVGLIALYLLPPVFAAIACALGRDFRYPLMGRRLARYLGYDLTRSSEEKTWLVEEHEDRWVASMGHFSIIIVIWGLLVPIFSWALQGKRSLFLKFQAIQAFAYQAGTTLLYFAAGFFYVFGIAVFLLTIGFEGEISFDSSNVLIGAVVFFISLLVTLLILLAVPLLHILGQWAGYRVLKGDGYRYPIVGRMVEKWMAKQ